VSFGTTTVALERHHLVGKPVFGAFSQDGAAQKACRAGCPFVFCTLQGIRPAFFIGRHGRQRICDPELSGDIYEPFQKIAHHAGLGTIVSPFVNMRRSRSNEVVREFGSELESRWIGHTEKVMGDHYFRSTDEGFSRAAGKTLHAESHAIGRPIEAVGAVFH